MIVFMKITKMMLMQDVMENYTKSMNFHININDLTDEFCARLKKLARQNRGKVQLTVNVDDPEHDMTLFMSSGEINVEPKVFSKLLAEMPEVRNVTFNGK